MITSVWGAIFDAKFFVAFATDNNYFSLIHHSPAHEDGIADRFLLDYLLNNGFYNL